MDVGVGAHTLWCVACAWCVCAPGRGGLINQESRGQLASAASDANAAGIWPDQAAQYKTDAAVRTHAWEQKAGLLPEAAAAHSCPLRAAALWGIPVVGALSAVHTCVPMWGGGREGGRARLSAARCGVARPLHMPVCVHAHVRCARCSTRTPHHSPTRPHPPPLHRHPRTERCGIPLRPMPAQYWENLLVPLDNMITRDTARFVGSKDPDYLTSVFQVRICWRASTYGGRTSRRCVRV